MAKSEAHETFDALPEWKKVRIAEEVFKLMEYDQNGEPGASWSGGDVCQWISDTFGTFGVTFTPAP